MLTTTGNRRIRSVKRACLVAMAIAGIIVLGIAYVRANMSPEARVVSWVDAGKVCGKTIAELEALLGPAKVVGAGENFPGWDYYFDLGRSGEPYFQIDLLFLVIVVDDAGTVVRADLIEG